MEANIIRYSVNNSLVNTPSQAEGNDQTYKRARVPGIENVIDARVVEDIRVHFGKLLEQRVGNTCKGSVNKGLPERNSGTNKLSLEHDSANSVVNLENPNIPFETGENRNPDMGAVIKNFKQQNPYGSVVDFAMSLQLSDSGKALLGELFGILSVAAQKQGINLKVKNSRKFTNLYVDKAKRILKNTEDYLPKCHFSYGSKLNTRLFDLIPSVSQSFASPEKCKSEVENLFQNLNLDPMVRDHQDNIKKIMSFIFLLINLSKREISYKNIDLGLAAQILELGIVIEEDEKDKCHFLNKDRKIFATFEYCKDFHGNFRFKYSGKKGIDRGYKSKMYDALFLTQNILTGKLATWERAQKDTWLRNNVK